MTTRRRDRRSRYRGHGQRLDPVPEEDEPAGSAPHQRGEGESQLVVGLLRVGPDGVKPPPRPRARRAAAEQVLVQFRRIRSSAPKPGLYLGRAGPRDVGADAGDRAAQQRSAAAVMASAARPDELAQHDGGGPGLGQRPLEPLAEGLGRGGTNRHAEGLRHRREVAPGSSTEVVWPKRRADIRAGSRSRRRRPPAAWRRCRAGRGPELGQGVLQAAVADDAEHRRPGCASGADRRRPGVARVPDPSGYRNCWPPERRRCGAAQ